MTDLSLRAPDTAFDQAERPADPSLSGLLAGLWRKRLWIVVPTILVAALTVVFLFMVTPLYRSETRVLIEPQETAFTRPEAEQGGRQSVFDEEAVNSQVQVILSVDVARQVIRDLDFANRAEFNSDLRPPSLLGMLRDLLPIGGGDGDDVPVEDQLLGAYYERLVVYQITDSRVIAILFRSEDPVLAANAANAIADGYLALQRSARRDSTQEASAWLSGQIDDLRARVEEAEQAVEDYRAETGLFQVLRGQTTGSSLSAQQLSDISVQITDARARRSDAEARARLIRELQASGQQMESNDVLNSQLIQRLFEQQVGLRAQIAELSSTLLSSHPRMRELNAQLANLDRQVSSEIERVVRGLENEAAVAAAQEGELNDQLELLKLEAAESNAQEVRLRALEREATAQRDLLESYLARFRDASARGSLDATPADARIVSQATVPLSPYFPKKSATLVAAVIATVLVTTALALAHELAQVYAQQNAQMRTGRQGPAPSGPVVMHPTARDETYHAPAASSYAPTLDLDDRDADPRAVSQPVRPPQVTPGVRHAETAVDAPPEPAPVRSAPVRPDAVATPSMASERSAAAAVSTSMSPVTAVFERLRGSVATRRDSGSSLVLTTGAQAGHDTVHVALAAATALSADGHRVVLIDGDLARNGLAPLTGSKPLKAGLADLLEGRASFEAAMYRLPQSRVHAIAAGEALSDPEALLLGAQFETVLSALRDTYDVVIVILPPMARSLAGETLAREADHALVAYAGDASARARDRALERLTAAGIETCYAVDAAALAEAVATV